MIIFLLNSENLWEINWDLILLYFKFNNINFNNWYKNKRALRNHKKFLKLFLIYKNGGKQANKNINL